MVVELILTKETTQSRLEIEKIQNDFSLMRYWKNTLQVKSTIEPHLTIDNLQEWLLEYEKDNPADIIIVCLGGDKLIENDLVNIMTELWKNDYWMVKNERIGAYGYSFHSSGVYHPAQIEYSQRKFFTPDFSKINSNGLFNDEVEKIILS